MIGVKRLTNLEQYTSVLSEPEIDLVAAVVCAALNQLKTGASVGAFILVGQKYGKPADTILGFGLPRGHIQKQRWLPQQTDFAEKAELAIHHFANEPMYSKVETGVHRDGSYLALIVNTNSGRFIATLYADFPEKSDDHAEFVLYVVADVLARFSNDMLVTQQARRILFHTARPAEIAKFANKLFSERVLPEVLIWQNWRDSASVRAGEIFV